MQNVRASAVRPRQIDLAIQGTHALCSTRAATTRPREKTILSSRRPRSRARVSELLHSVGYLHHCAPEDGCAHSSQPIMKNSVVQLQKGPVWEGEIPGPNQKGWDPFRSQPPQGVFVFDHHPGDNVGANLRSISHRCYLFEVTLVWELAKETIFLPLCASRADAGLVINKFSSKSIPGTTFRVSSGQAMVGTSITGVLRA